jgi:hypothetical protein
VLNANAVGVCTSNNKESKQAQNALNPFVCHTIILVTKQNEYRLLPYISGNILTMPLRYYIQNQSQESRPGYPYSAVDPVILVFLLLITEKYGYDITMLSDVCMCVPSAIGPNYPIS